MYQFCLLSSEGQIPSNSFQSLFFQMMSTSEKLCLQWNDFKDNIISSFKDLREDKDFTDVTLVCKSGQQIEAHKVILASASPLSWSF